MIRLKVEALSYQVAGKYLIEDINLEIKTGSMVGLIGPNGAGKSTLLRNIYRVLKPSHGCVFLNGENIRKLSNKDVAKNMSVVSQEDTSVGFDFKVLDIVLLGRFAHKTLLEFNDQLDTTAAFKALNQVDMESYHDRDFLSLSGGEKQRVMIARAICQGSNVIIMDEPTNSLDIKHQLSILNYIKRMDITSFIALHDINMATIFCDRLIVLKEGKLLYSGDPQEIITSEVIKNIFGVESHIITNPITRKKAVLFS